MRPFAAAVARLDASPGVGLRTAEVLVAEVGADVRRFPTAARLASWAGMGPGNHESAGARAAIDPDPSRGGCARGRRPAVVGAAGQRRGHTTGPRRALR